MQTDRARLSTITARYRDLQGLKQVVSGAMLVAIFGWTLVYPVTLRDIRSPAEYERFSFGVGILLLVAVAWVVSVLAVGAWYNRVYGRVSHTPQQRRPMVILAIAGCAAFLVPFEAEIFSEMTGARLPINVMVLGLSAWIVGYWFYLGHSFVHYLVIAAFGVILTMLSVAGLPPNGFASHLRVALLFMGVASIVGGLVDHRILTRALTPLRSVGFDS